MIHSYLSRYTCYPWRRVQCAIGSCGQSYSIHLGVSGHGRAFQYIAKAVEDNAVRLLGISCALGRQCAAMSEHMRGGYLPCRKDLRRLYNGSRYEALWAWLATSRDDNVIMTGLLLGAYRRPHPRGRRKSDSFLLLASRQRALRLD